MLKRVTLVCEAKTEVSCGTAVMVSQCGLASYSQRLFHKGVVSPFRDTLIALICIRKMIKTYRMRVIIDGISHKDLFELNVDRRMSCTSRTDQFISDGIADTFETFLLHYPQMTRIVNAGIVDDYTAYYTLEAGY